LRGTRDTGKVGRTGEYPRLGHSESKRERARESDHHGMEKPFPLSRITASIELSKNLNKAVCQDSACLSFTVIFII
jgi:hypothetical protein